MLSSRSIAVLLGVVVSLGAATAQADGTRSWAKVRDRVRFTVGSDQQRLDTVRKGPLGRALNYVRWMAKPGVVLASHESGDGLKKVAKRYTRGEVGPGAVFRVEHELTAERGGLFLKTTTTRLVPEEGYTQRDLIDLIEQEKAENAHLAPGDQWFVAWAHFIDFTFDSVKVPIDPRRDSDLEKLRTAIPHLDSFETRYRLHEAARGRWLF